MAYLLFNLLYSFRMSRVYEDRICWTPSKRRMLEVRSFYRVLCPPAGSSFPWKNIWRNKAPPRVAFFIWTTMLGKILTLDNLRKMHALCDGLVLHVQEERGIHWPSSVPLRCSNSFVVIGVQYFWGRMGHATTDGGVVAQLEGHLKRTQCQNTKHHIKVLLRVRLGLWFRRKKKKKKVWF
jgi:hypothetical protein